MNQLLTRGIILTRTDYGEADRILTLLTPNYGKIRLMAKGVRKIKSKLAGGIELFSVSDITFIRGRGDIGTLVSARLDRHYSGIVAHLDRVQLGYDIIKKLHRATEDEPETEYFNLLEQSFAALDSSVIPAQLINTWFQAHLVKLAGHSPNLGTDTNHEKLVVDRLYSFDIHTMSFTPHSTGSFTTKHIKLLRLLFSDAIPGQLNRIENVSQLLPTITPLIATMLGNAIRV